MKSILYYSGSSRHPFFINEFKNMPEEFKWIPSDEFFKKEKRKFTKRRQRKLLNINKIINVEGIVLNILIWLGFPKIFILNTEYDNIWSCGYLLKTNKPYYVTFEDVSVFYFHNFRRWNRFISTFLIKKALLSKKCKGIIPWTKAAEKSFFSVFQDKRLRKKTQVIFPSILPKVKEAKEYKDSDKKNVLLVGKAFLRKGGYDLILAFKKLNMKNVKLQIVSEIPKSIMNEVKDMKNIEIYNNISNEKKEQLFKDAYVYVMPTHMDTLGWTFFEAMSCGVPCIGANHFSTPEIISNNKDGLIVESNTCSLFDSNGLHKMPKKKSFNHNKELLYPKTEYVNELHSKLKKVLTDSEFRNKLAKNALEKTKSGKMSVERKKREIKEILK